MNFKFGWLDGCETMFSNHFHLSPQLQYRGDGKKLIVLHCISLPSGSYDNERVEKLFTHDLQHKDSHILQSIMKKSGRVSTHFYIKRGGERIQFVPVHYCAWHAGISEYQGEQNCNDFSLGIELQGKIDEEFTRYQYQSLQYICLALRKKFLKLNEIMKNTVAHSDISPQRKQDPGRGFDWDCFSKMMNSENN